MYKIKSKFPFGIFEVLMRKRKLANIVFQYLGKNLIENGFSQKEITEKIVEKNLFTTEI